MECGVSSQLNVRVLESIQVFACTVLNPYEHLVVWVFGGNRHSRRFEPL